MTRWTWPVAAMLAFAFLVGLALHGQRPDILVEFLKTWDIIAAEEGKKSPFFKKVHDSQRAYASVVVPAKRFYFPPYSFAANYYWPEGGAKSTAGAAKK